MVPGDQVLCAGSRRWTSMWSSSIICGDTRNLVCTLVALPYAALTRMRRRSLREYHDYDNDYANATWMSFCVSAALTRMRPLRELIGHWFGPGSMKSGR